MLHRAHRVTIDVGRPMQSPSRRSICARATLRSCRRRSRPRDAQAADWFQWRGPNRDGHSAETGLLKEWPAGGRQALWQATGAGTGYSSFSSSNGRLYTLGARGDTEYVMAFDAASGKKLLGGAERRRFRNEQGDGPRSTPTIDGDRRVRVRRQRRAERRSTRRPARGSGR